MNGTGERAHHHSSSRHHASPTLSYTAPQHRSHTVPPLPPTGRALQPTARGPTTTTSSEPSSTYWQPQPRAHTPSSKPPIRRNPTTPCNPAKSPPQPPRTRTRSTSDKNPPPPRPFAAPPPRKDIYTTLAGTLPHPMDAEQYYQSVHRELPTDHTTLQGWRLERGEDNEWGTEDDLLWEDTWKGTMDTFLEAAAVTYPRPPGDTRHGLHALLAYHSCKHRNTITLHP